MKRTLPIIAAALWLASQACEGAALTVTLSGELLHAPPGTELALSGSLSNNSPSNALFLNGLQAVFTGSASNALRLGSNAFFANVPGLLLPGEVYTGVVFQVRLLETAPPGDYDGAIALQGGADIFAADDLGGAAFSLTTEDHPFERWRLQKFGAASHEPEAADNADWDGDGLQNILEYALNLDPTVADIRPLPPPQILHGHLQWSCVPNPDATDVLLVVEASTDLVHWSAADVASIRVDNPDPPSRLTFQYVPPAGVVPQAFLRLRAIRTAPGL